MNNNLVHETRSCQSRIRTFLVILINIRKKKCSISFSLLKQRRTQNNNNNNHHHYHQTRTLSSSHLVFLLISTQSLPPLLLSRCRSLSLSLSLPSFFLLFSRTHASVHYWLEKKNEGRP